MEVAGVTAPAVLPVVEEDVEVWAEADRAREMRRSDEASCMLITTVVRALDEVFGSEEEGHKRM
jgi:hypothetical protein